MAFSLVNTPAVVTQASESLSQSYTATGDADVLLCVSQRGSSGSPTSVTFGGQTCAVCTDLAQITGSSRGMRWYRLLRANHPGAGSRTIAVSWAGVDNIGVGIFEIRADGSISVSAQVAQSDDDSSLTLSITAGTGDLTISSALANANVTFTPASGQTEYLESAWFTNTGHVVGIQNGAQTAANWTGIGSTCGCALVLHEESSATQASLAETSSITTVVSMTAGITLQASLAESLALSKTDALTAGIILPASLAETKALSKTDALTAGIILQGALAESSALTKTDAIQAGIVFQTALAESTALQKTETLTAGITLLAALVESATLGKTDALQAGITITASLLEAFSFTPEEDIRTPSQGIPTRITGSILLGPIMRSSIQKAKRQASAALIPKKGTITRN